MENNSKDYKNAYPLEDEKILKHILLKTDLLNRDLYEVGVPALKSLGVSSGDDESIAKAVEVLQKSDLSPLNFFLRGSKAETVSRHRAYDRNNLFHVSIFNLYGLFWVGGYEFESVGYFLNHSYADTVAWDKASAFRDDVIFTGSLMDGLCERLIDWCDLSLTEEQIEKIYSETNDIDILEWCDGCDIYRDDDEDLIERPGSTDIFFDVVSESPDLLKEEVRQSILSILKESS